MQEADAFCDGILFHTALKRALFLRHPTESTGSTLGSEDQQKYTACRRTGFIFFPTYL